MGFWISITSGQIIVPGGKEEVGSANGERTDSPVPLGNCLLYGRGS